VVEFQSDILKILLDKLLLGAIAALFGFYLSRLLENHRAKNAYWQAVAIQRTEACRELVNLAVKHHEYVLALYDTVDKVVAKHLAGKKPTRQDAKGGYEYIQHQDEFRRIAAALAVLLSPDVLAAFNTYLDKTNVVAQVIKGEFPPERPTKEKLDEAFVAFLSACSAAIVKNPFEKVRG
jgi:hypothetical protein